jgi:hypothetical protein
MYLNPNRPWRRTVLSAASLFGMPMGYRQLMESDSVTGFQYVQPQGYVHTGQPRGPDTTDDAQALVKFAIVRMESRRQKMISTIFDQSGGEIAHGAVPDVFAPLQELVTSLLPHLEFVRVDVANDADQRCIFRKLDTPTPIELDIDDLSSGEKAVIQLFLPFIESQIEQLFAATIGASVSGPLPTAIIDEPELHLHPSLQTALVAYMRVITKRGDAQFIVATHSTTMMDALEDDELYLLAPPSSVGSESQLRRLSASSERLELVREITGSTHVVTRCRPIVFLEGARPDGKAVSDQRLIELLIPEAKSWVLVAAQGRNQAISSARALRDPTLTELPGIPVFALVDEDQGDSVTDDFVIPWRVCMIENLLLDPVAIWELLEPHREKLRLTSKHDVVNVLRSYCEDRVAEEVRLRVLRRLRQPHFDYRVTSRDELDNLASATASMATKYIEEVDGEEGVEAAVEVARSEVSSIKAGDTMLERFHGKDLLKRFFDEHGKRGGFGYPAFAYGLAKHVAGGERAARLLSTPVRKIRQYVPRDLSSAIEACANALSEDWHVKAAASAGSVDRCRSLWESGEQDDTDRRSLRRQILEVSRNVHDNGRSDLHQALLAQLVQLGDG